jgi:hypothetical protein
MNKKNNSSGQILLLAVLSMATILTVVLSAATRSISDISITSAEEESIKAFSAAEAGIEQTLLSGTAASGAVGTQQSSGTASYNTTISSAPVSQYVYPIELSSGGLATVWLVSHDQNNNYVCGAGNPCYNASSLRLCWGKAGTSSSVATTPAVQVVTVYQNAGAIDTRVLGYDPNSNRRTSDNNFTNSAGSCGAAIGGTNFAFGTTVDFSTIPGYSTAGTLKSIVVRMVYNDVTHPLGIASTGNLPSQSRQVSSVGTSGTSSRKVEVNSLYPELPEIFSSAIFSINGISK